jgi:hypothetical protein
MSLGACMLQKWTTALAESSLQIPILISCSRLMLMACVNGMMVTAIAQGTCSCFECCMMQMRSMAAHVLLLLLMHRALNAGVLAA